MMSSAAHNSNNNNVMRASSAGPPHIIMNTSNQNENPNLRSTSGMQYKNHQLPL